MMRCILKILWEIFDWKVWFISVDRVYYEMVHSSSESTTKRNLLFDLDFEFSFWLIYENINTYET